MEDVVPEDADMAGAAGEEVGDAGWEWEEDTGTVQGGPTGRTSCHRDSMEPAKTAAQALETELGDASIQA